MVWQGRVSFLLLGKMDWVSIPLTNKSGFCAIVDKDDFDKINQYNWMLGGGGGKLRPNKGYYYAMRHEYLGPGKIQNIYMHRVILGLMDNAIFTDHINNNSLDNRKANLRTCTNGQNQSKLPPRVGRYKGVYQNKRSGKFTVKVGKIYGGCFTSEEEAARKYDEMAIKYFTKEFAYLNFPNNN